MKTKILNLKSCKTTIKIELGLNILSVALCICIHVMLFFIEIPIDCQDIVVHMLSSTLLNMMMLPLTIYIIKTMVRNYTYMKNSKDFSLYLYDEKTYFDLQKTEKDMQIVFIDRDGVAVCNTKDIPAYNAWKMRYKINYKLFLTHYYLQ